VTINHVGSSPSILDPIVIPLVKGPRILDVGCGFGRWGALLTTNLWEASKSKPANRSQIVGCDGHLPNVEESRKNNYYQEVLHLTFPPLPFCDDSFDTVLLLDVLEHLNVNDGRKLVDEAKRVSRQRVILSTPNWCALRDAHRTITGWNPFEAHLSYWPRHALRDLEFKLYGAGSRPGGRYWRIGLKKMKLLSFYDRILRSSIGSLSLFFPFIAENVVGVWERQKGSSYR
jgi:SAM-dependent methyltransferase